MCDYSLQYVASRPAEVGDKLVSSRFNQTISRGFTAAGDPNTAVCLMPGTEIAFEKEVEFENPLGYANQRTRSKVARFRQVNKDQPYTHHDALEFADGQIVLVTRLVDGQHATVLQLPPTARSAEEAAAQKRVPIVA